MSKRAIFVKKVDERQKEVIIFCNFAPEKDRKRIEVSLKDNQPKKNTYDED
ncbi:MAG: hypothetical protein J5545_06065 [Bacteroidaceae bacterium]|nr:hypothetical protein [Bacteroidaceae bacterium]